MLRKWRLLAIVIVALVGLPALWFALRAVESHRYEARLKEVKRAISAGAPLAARDLLKETVSRWPREGEARYLLGACELSLGDQEAAKKAWLSVPPDNQFAPHAALMLARRALENHRLAEAELYLPTALAGEGRTGIEALQSLLVLYKLQGRLEEAKRLVQNGWSTYPDRVGTLQQSWQLDYSTSFLVDEHRRMLETAYRAAPDDDRVWLAFAYLEARVARFAESARWLKACEERRPNDPVVWHSWLNWALATQDLNQARRALDHLPADFLTPMEVLGLKAWFAARKGDAAAERQALEALLEIAPGHMPTIDRLAGLAIQAGDSAIAEALRERQANLERTRERYVDRLYKPDQMAAAEQFARDAETLGRTFEARGWWYLASGRNPALKPEYQQAIARFDAIERKQAAAEKLPALIASLGPPAPQDSSSTPLLAEGVAPFFKDDAERAGLQFVFDSGKSYERQIPETMGSGVALLDYDRDGWLDIYLTQGGPFPPGPGQDRHGGDRLFRNLGDGTFEDATESSGIAGFPQSYGFGATSGDFDNDGDLDLFVARWRAYAFYRNRGDSTFEDATEAVGLGGDRGWPTIGAFADLDNDSDLDLYVSHYLDKWDELNPRVCQDPPYPGPRLCNPGLFPAQRDRLYRNDGGKFIDVTDEAGIDDPDGRSMGLVAADFDEDGLIDLYVANDQTANYLWHNLGNWKFEEMAHAAGVAASSHGGYEASMGTTCGDLDGDGRVDLISTSFYDEGTTFYQNLGEGIFTDRSHPFGLNVATRYFVSFGIALLDANNDGHLDIAQSNGHVDDFRPETPYAMLPCILVGGDNKRFIDVSKTAGDSWQREVLGRALASGDLDNDGRMDLVMVCLDEPLVYFHNQTEEAGHWLTLDLEGTASNRDGVGARVRVSAGGKAFVAQRIGAGGMQSTSSPRLHYGLSQADRVEKIEVRWPSGQVDTFADLAADTGYLLREKAAEPLPLPGFQNSSQLSRR